MMSDEQVPVGETILTSGGDQIFPKGLTVGTVAKVDSGKDLFLNVKVKPAANLSRLEEVLVVLQKQERQATAQETVRVRAADILAQRLPSVPEKPATDATAVGAGAKGKAPAGPNGTQAQPPSGANPKPGIEVPARLGALPTLPNPKSAGPNGSPNLPRAGQTAGPNGSAVNSGPAGNSPRPKPTASPARPANTQPPPAIPPQPNPQSPVADDGPH
jgi:rod shape-determining protein MreC